ncbi:MAG: type I DNA topoisomerase [Candidatus Omnitrophica bacterium]|nr:type I DNA topoisomerase [Candidatus Omnitrophota bacterium]
MTRVKVNGEDKTFPGDCTVEDLLKRLKIQPELVAVEHNEKIIKRADYAKAAVKEGDCLEIVRFIGGGSAGKALVIVESPAKAKTIHKILGGGYVVKSSMGHVIDLPSGKMGIDIEKDFNPTYVVIKERKKNLAELKKEAKTSDRIYLAPDPDREGEAISWHLAGQLREKNDNKPVYRIVFHEITERAIQEAFQHPGQIDMGKVNAQQARRILDRIVGYSLSPLLWQKVGRGLSAGRVQSVALRLIVEREREIKAFVPKEYWDLEAELQKQGSEEQKPFTAKLEKVDGEKAEVPNEETAKKLVEELEKAAYVVSDIKEQDKKRNPQAPFTTSKMQQDAFNKLRFSAERTMRIAQQLYEGIDLGKEGTAGLITYMRTDSVRVADVALKEVREYIHQKYGEKYFPERPNVYRSKKQAQEAHEAIRPTAVERTPEKVKSSLSEDQYKLYELIWNKFVASQMTPALYQQKTVDIQAGRCLFRATGSHLLFDGFTVLYRDSDQEEEKELQLPPLAVADVLKLLRLTPTQHFTKPPPRYTDASLVKTLEEKGIGRPSTYSPTIQTIVARHYVDRREGALYPTELGVVVAELLIAHFPNVMDYEFTATMEEHLDEIEEGKENWVDVLKRFYGPFAETVETAKNEMKRVKKVEEKTDQVCEKCGKIMVIKWGRYGRFVSCSGFPECKNAKPITSGVKCPEPGCTGELVQKRSSKGRVFYGCSRYPDCRHLARRLPKEAGSSP